MTDDRYAKTSARRECAAPPRPAGEPARAPAGPGLSPHELRRIVLEILG
jgi:hypothetical protein